MPDQNRPEHGSPTPSGLRPPALNRLSDQAYASEKRSLRFGFPLDQSIESSGWIPLNPRGPLQLVQARGAIYLPNNAANAAETHKNRPE